MLSGNEKRQPAGQNADSQKVQTLFDMIEEKPIIKDKVSQTKIDDIRKAIGINEKFRFINELFNGDIQEYNQAVDRLNALTSMDEADNFLEKFRVQYVWDEEGEVYQEFIKIVRRRYL